MRSALVLGFVLSLLPTASAQMVITEWMYSGANGEFVEFTNVGTSPVDMSGWSFDDSSQTPGTVDLSSFGVVAPGESVILTEAIASEFATAWNLNGITIIGELSASLGRNDQINLYDSGNALVAQLGYGDEDYPGTPRTQYVSCNIPESGYGETVAQTNWNLAEVGDSFGSRTSSGGDIASPGRLVGYALSDYDRDGDVDLADLDAFSNCMTGAYQSYDPLPTECGLVSDGNGVIPADADADYDVDLADYATFQMCFSGDGNPADPSCGHVSEPPTDTLIDLHDTYITVNGSGVSINGTNATITEAGSYIINGTLSDGQIIVNTSTSGLVKITLDGVNISNSTTAPFFIMNADSVEVILADQTENVLTDAETYIYEDPEEDEPNACLFSKDTLLIDGTGTLTVYGNYNDAIASKDELIVANGNITAIATDDGIRGKDFLLIQNGDVTVVSGGDGLKSDNDSDTELGYITVENGSLQINSGGDGLAAETDVTISGGDLTVVSCGGHTATLPPDTSAKGIKGLVSVSIEGGTLDLDCADDGLHSNDTVEISGGTTTIASGDDAIHADNSIGIGGGMITITNSYEGIESGIITISDGDIMVVSDEDSITAETTVSVTGGELDIISGGGHNASLPPDFSAKGIKGLVDVMIEGGTFFLDCADDGIHSNDNITIDNGTFTIATGDDAIHADATVEINGGTITVTASYEGIEGSDVIINDGNIHVVSSDDGINGAGGDGSGGWPGPPPAGDHYLYINGGHIVVNADGDGIDVNGYIVMTGGTVLVHGPTENFNSALDYDRTFNISGGLLVAAGSGQMAQAPSSSSTQRSVKISYSQWKNPGTLARIQTSSGTDIATFAPLKHYQSLVVSSPSLQTGTTYQLYRGGSSTGTNTDGLYIGGTYSGGTLTNTFTPNYIVTNISAP